MQETNHLVTQGHNNPPDNIDLLREEYKPLRDAAQQWIDAGDLTADTADAHSAFCKQIKAWGKKVESARKEEKKPHDQAGEAVQEKYRPVILAGKNLLKKMEPLQTDYLKKLEEETRAAKAEAEARAVQARREAEAAESRAIETGCLAASDEAAEAAEAAGKAAEHLKEVRQQKAHSGSNVIAGGTKRATYLKTKIVQEVTDPREAIKWMSTKTNWARLKGSECESIGEAAAKVIKRLLKDDPDLKIPGTKSAEKSKAVL